MTITAQAVESGTDTVVDSSFLEEGTANKYLRGRWK